MIIIIIEIVAGTTSISVVALAVATVVEEKNS